MLQKIIKGTHIHRIDYMYEFTDEDGCGFAFPCDSHGNIWTENLTDEAFDNLMACMAHSTDFYFTGIREYPFDYTEDDIGICKCGGEVILDRENNYYGAVQCPECGRWYNLFGQELNDPSTWDDFGDDY